MDWGYEAFAHKYDRDTRNRYADFVTDGIPLLF